MSLKYLIAALVVIGPFLVSAKVDIPPALQKKLTQLHNDCLKERGLTEGDFKKFDLKKKDPAMNCYLRCLLTRPKWTRSSLREQNPRKRVSICHCGICQMNDDEVLQVDYIKQNIHSSVKHITLPELENCGKKAAEGGECEKTYNFFSCMNQAEPEDWILM